MGFQASPDPRRLKQALRVIIRDSLPGLPVSGDRGWPISREGLAMRLPTLLLMCALSDLLAVPSSSGELVQVRQDFSRDPGWDHHQNRIAGTEMPAVIQDFGWRRTGHTGGPGEIGGRVENSRVQAYYAMPLGKPLTFDDELSASGKLVLRHIGLRGVGYVGFFNSRRHTWRVWNSMAFRVWEEDGLGQVMFDWMSGDRQARGAEIEPPSQPSTSRAHRSLAVFSPSHDRDDGSHLEPIPVGPPLGR